MIEILPKTQADIKEYLHGIAEKHANRSDGFLVPLPIDQDKYPGQSLFDSVVKSDRLLGPNEADTFAAGVDDRYQDLIRAYDEYTLDGSDTAIRFNQILHAVSAGSHIVNGTDHAELVDIIFNHLHFTNRIRRAQLRKAEILDEKPNKHAIRSGIVVSKMIDFLGIEKDGLITPVRDLLSLGFDRTYLTIPPIKVDSQTEKRAIKTYNAHVRSQVTGDMLHRPFSNRHPMILGVALPGTVNKQSAENQNITVVGRVNDGVLDFVRNALLVVSAVRMREHGSTIFIDDVLANIYTPEQLQAHMGRLILGINHLDKREHVYDKTGQMAVLEPDSFRVE